LIGVDDKRFKKCFKSDVGFIQKKYQKIKKTERICSHKEVRYNLLSFFTFLNCNFYRMLLRSAQSSGRNLTGKKLPNAHSFTIFGHKWQFLLTKYGKIGNFLPEKFLPLRNITVLFDNQRFTIVRFRVF